MTTRTFALVLGIVFLLVGILGFVPAALTHPAVTEDPLRVQTSEGYLLGLFHVNALHSAVHILFGVMGIVMFRQWGTARLYCQIVAVAYALFAIIGLIPVIDTVFGFVPLHGHDVWLHAIIAIAAGYFGFLTAPQAADAIPHAGTTSSAS